MSISEWIESEVFKNPTGHYSYQPPNATTINAVQFNCATILSGLLPSHSNGIVLSGLAHIGTLEIAARTEKQVFLFVGSESTAEIIARHFVNEPNIVVFSGNSWEVQWKRSPELQIEFQPMNAKALEYSLFGIGEQVTVALHSEFEESGLATAFLAELKSPFHGLQKLGSLTISGGAVASPKQIGVFSSLGRRPEFETLTHLHGKNDTILVEKVPQLSKDGVTLGKLSLLPCSSYWQSFPSLQYQLIHRLQSVGPGSVESIFSVCKPWLVTLRIQSTERSGRAYLDGKFLDAVWGNTFVDSGTCTFVDQEWHWSEEIPLNVVVIRSIFTFLTRIYKSTLLSSDLKSGCTVRLIHTIARSIGASLTINDYIEFCLLESELQATLLNARRSKLFFTLILHLVSAPLYYKSRALKAALVRKKPGNLTPQDITY